MENQKLIGLIRDVLEADRMGSFDRICLIGQYLDEYKEECPEFEMGKNRVIPLNG
jgi:hypothetical protein